MKKNLFMAAMGLLVMAGCSSNDEIDNLVANNDNAITFDTYVGKVTKAEPGITIPFGVFAYQGTFAAATSTPNFMYNQKVETDGTYSPKKYWPGTSVSFIAYAPYIDNSAQAGLVNYPSGKAGLPIIDFSITANADVDLLASDLVTASSGQISLVLKHALSKVSFSAGNTGDENTTINITKVELTGMSQTATLHFGETARTWGTYSKTDIFAVTKSTPYLLIPQPLAGLAASITYTITTTDKALPGGSFTTEPKTVPIPLATETVTEWETSKQYSYTIKPELGLITLKATVEEDWGTQITPTIPKQ